jgi:tetratricopeptide (TPR) repeat protein
MGVSSQPEADALLATGVRYYAGKTYDKALEVWQAAQKLYEKAGRKRELGIVSSYMARALAALDRHKEALVNCTQAVRLLREADEFAELQRALVTMGRALENLGHVEEATRAFEQALDVHPGEEHATERVGLLLETGSALERAGHFNRSLSRYADAAKAAETAGDRDLHADALTAHARILQQIGSHQQATSVLQELSRLLDKLGKPVLSAHALLGLASSLIAQGLIDKAEDTINKALAIFAKSGDTSGELVAEYHLTRILLLRGLPTEALSHADRVLKEFEKEGDLVGQAQSSLLVADISVKVGNEQRALQLYDRAIELFAQAKEQAHSLQAHVSKGKALLRLGKQAQAEKEFTQALRYYREHQNPEQEARIYLEVADLLNELGNYDDAVEHCKLAIQRLQDMKDEEAEIKTYDILLRATQKGSRPKEGFTLIQQAVERARIQNKMVLSSSLSISLAQLTIDEAPDEAVTILEKAIQNSQLPQERRAEVALSLSKALMKQGQFAKAAQHLNQTIADSGAFPGFDTSGAYYLLSEAYRHLNQPRLRKESLEGALAHLPQSADELFRARLHVGLAALAASDDQGKAVQEYQEAASLFEKWDSPQEQFNALLEAATLLVSRHHEEALPLTEKALMLAEELDIRSAPSGQREQLPRAHEHLQQAIEVALLVALAEYSVRKERTSIASIMDWSTRRKVAQLLPFLATNLGFERCTELPQLQQEESRLVQQAAGLLQQLAQLPRTEASQKAFTSRRAELRSQLADVLNKLDVNRNVAAAACADPGQTLPPRNYKILDKLMAIMPPDRRWVLLNYDVLLDRNRIIVTMTDHVGRHSSYALPVSPDLPSIISKFQAAREANELPPIAELQDLGAYLYRSLVPGKLARDLETHPYGYLQIIPDVHLNQIPFELIFDGRDYWGLKYPMSWAPDAFFLESALKTQALAPTATPSLLVGVNTNPDERLKRKRTADESAKAFLAAVQTSPAASEAPVLVGPEFNRERLLAALEQPRTLIFLFTPTSIHHRKGEISLLPPDSLRAVELGTTFAFPGAPILVLNECIQLDNREDGLSLAAFLRCLTAAGATSVVFSRWLPNPSLQPQFAAELGKRLSEGDPISLALMHARRKLASLTPSPQSWIPYSLCGNPFPSLS